MELFQLRYFVATAHNLHFTRAAEESHVSQPSVSQQVANLERELGCALFYRRGRSITLTDAGAALLVHAERILAEEDAGRRAVEEVLGLRQGTLTVWTLPTPGQQLLPPLLAGYRRRYPGVKISLRETVPASAVAEAVATGIADIGIVHLPYHVHGLSERLLLTEDLAIVAPITHRLAHEECVSLSDFAEEDFIWAPEGSTEAHPLYAVCLAAGFVPRIACVCGSAKGMQALVAAGLGIALLPRLAIDPPAGTQVIELQSPRPTRTLVAVWIADRLSTAAAAFLETMPMAHY